MSLPGQRVAARGRRRRDDFAYASGEAVVRLLELGIRPRQIMTKEAFENAIAVTMALGGSTNAVLHLLAIANEARVELVARRLQPRRRPRAPHRRHQAGRQVPHGRPRPRRRRADGDAPPARRRAPPRRLPHRHRQDHGREPRRARSAGAGRRRGPPARRTRCTRSAASPSSPGRWRPRARWSRWRASNLDRFDGPARVFDGEDAAMDAILAGPDQPGRRRRDPLRRPEGRPRDARDARRHRGDEGRGPRGRLRARHRRPFLRRHARFLHRPRRARGGRRRADRVRAGRRPRSASTSTPTRSRST